MDAMRANGVSVAGGEISLALYVVHNGVKYQDLHRYPVGQKMADLPEEVIAPSSPLTHFACLSSRAVSTEVCDNMTTGTSSEPLLCVSVLVFQQSTAAFRNYILLPACFCGDRL